MGLGASRDGEGTQCGIPEDHRPKNLEGAGWSGKVRAGNVPGAEGSAVSHAAGGVDVSSCGGIAGYVSESSAEEAGNGDSAEVSGDLYCRDRVAVERRVSA